MVAELLRRGIVAALTPPGTPETDILVRAPDGAAAEIQVKTWVRSGEGGWMMGTHAGDLERDSLFYALVDWREVAAAVIYVVPSAVAASWVRRSFKEWLATPGRGGKPHDPDNKIRKLMPAEMDRFSPGWREQYLDAWHQVS